MRHELLDGGDVRNIQAATAGAAQPARMTFAKGMTMRRLPLLLLALAAPSIAAAQPASRAAPAAAANSEK
jgi:hypothetical protein